MLRIVIRQEEARGETLVLKDESHRWAAKQLCTDSAGDLLRDLRAGNDQASKTETLKPLQVICKSYELIVSLKDTTATFYCYIRESANDSI